MADENQGLADKVQPETTEEKGVTIHHDDAGNKLNVAPKDVGAKIYRYRAKEAGTLPPSIFVPAGHIVDMSAPYDADWLEEIKDGVSAPAVELPISPVMAVRSPTAVINQTNPDAIKDVNYDAQMMQIRKNENAIDGRVSHPDLPRGLMGERANDLLNPGDVGTPEAPIRENIGGDTSYTPANASPDAHYGEHGDEDKQLTEMAAADGDSDDADPQAKYKRPNGQLMNKAERAAVDAREAAEKNAADAGTGNQDVL